MFRLPYGISNFQTFIEEGYHYVDRTKYIETLEFLPYRYVIFLRPRRFGKSLFVSILDYYYGEQHQENFEQNFGQFYIGQHPTKGASKYLTLNFNFSGINTESKESTFKGFNDKVAAGIKKFFKHFSSFFKEEEQQEIIKINSPETMILNFFSLVSQKMPDKKIYIIIDEYDHFANELIAFKLNYFQEIVAAHGFVRKFYENIKIETGTGLVDRIFMTGVSPITLDSLTSGFNIATNLSIFPIFNEMMGFTDAEVRTMYEGIGIEKPGLEIIMGDIKNWYDGYLFNPKGNKIYNPDMVLYFGSYYATNHEYPPELLDENIASDYGKMRRLMRFGTEESETERVMMELLEKNSISAILTKQFSFEKRFDADNLVSLMFYLGLLTIEEVRYPVYDFKVPNFVIKTLFFDYFDEILRKKEGLNIAENEVRKAIFELAIHNNIQPLAEQAESVLKQLSNRDAVGFDEKYVKTIFTTLFYLSQIYTIHSEFETDRKYVDLLCTYRRPVDVPNQLIFELKYVKIQDAKDLKKKTDEGRTQLNAYLKHPKIKELENLKAWLLVFVGAELKVMENLQ